MFKWVSWGLVDSVSGEMESVLSFYDYVLGVLVFVFGLVTSVVVLLVAGKSGDWSGWGSGGLLVEMLWTGVPLLLVVGLAFPSIVNMYVFGLSGTGSCDVAVVAHQWYWEYVGFCLEDSYFMSDSSYHNLGVDNRLSLKMHTLNSVCFTSMDVAHSWGVPAMGLKVDCIPGVVSGMSVAVGQAGVFYGQCYELCGVMHSYMPIVVEVF